MKKRENRNHSQRGSKHPSKETTQNLLLKGKSLKPNPPEVASAKARVKALTRLLRSATAFAGDSAPFCYGSDNWYARKVPFRPEADCRFLGLLGVGVIQLLRGI